MAGSLPKDGHAPSFLSVHKEGILGLKLAS